jgi:hypothetical protein
MPMGEICTNTAWQRPHHPNKLTQQQHPTTHNIQPPPAPPIPPTPTTASTQHAQHPIAATQNPQQRSAGLSASKTGDDDDENENGVEKPKKTGQQVTRSLRSLRGGLLMENKPAGARKTGKKQVSPIPALFHYELTHIRTPHL